MGRITVFIKPDCKYCDKLKSILISAIRTHVIPAQEASKAAWLGIAQAANAAGGEHIQPSNQVPTHIFSSGSTFYGIQLVTIDVSLDSARSKQCMSLSGSRTVPQLFFQDEYMGTDRTVGIFAQCGTLRARLLQLARQGERTVVKKQRSQTALFGMPRSARRFLLASYHNPRSEPHLDTFPPAPLAEVIKVSEDSAFSSQPTLRQVRGFRQWGFKTVINLSHPREQSFLRSEGVVCRSTGVDYLSIPPSRAPVFPLAHVEVDLLPSIQMPTSDAECGGRGGCAGAGRRPKRRAQQQHPIDQSTCTPPELPSTPMDGSSSYDQSQAASRSTVTAAALGANSATDSRSSATAFGDIGGDNSTLPRTRQDSGTHSEAQSQAPVPSLGMHHVTSPVEAPPICDGDALAGVNSGIVPALASAPRCTETAIAGSDGQILPHPACASAAASPGSAMTSSGAGAGGGTGSDGSNPLPLKGLASTHPTCPIVGSSRTVAGSGPSHDCNVSNVPSKRSPVSHSVPCESRLDDTLPCTTPEGANCRGADAMSGHCVKMEEQRQLTRGVTVTQIDSSTPIASKQGICGTTLSPGASSVGSAKLCERTGTADLCTDRVRSGDRGITAAGQGGAKISSREQLQTSCEAAQIAPFSDDGRATTPGLSEGGTEGTRSEYDRDRDSVGSRDDNYTLPTASPALLPRVVDSPALAGIPSLTPLQGPRSYNGHTSGLQLPDAAVLALPPVRDEPLTTPVTSSSLKTGNESAGLAALKASRTNPAVSRTSSYGAAQGGAPGRPGNRPGISAATAGAGDISHDSLAASRRQIEIRRERSQSLGAVTDAAARAGLRVGRLKHRSTAVAVPHDEEALRSGAVAFGLSLTEGVRRTMGQGPRSETGRGRGRGGGRGELGATSSSGGRGASAAFFSGSKRSNDEGLAGKIPEESHGGMDAEDLGLGDASKGVGAIPAALSKPEEEAEPSHRSEGGSESGHSRGGRSQSGDSIGATTMTDVTRVWEFGVSELAGRGDASEHAWTLAWAERVLEQMETVPKPVLLHCQTGAAACTICLLRAARKLKASAKQVHKWSRDLGHSIGGHSDLEEVVALALQPKAKT